MKKNVESVLIIFLIAVIFISANVAGNAIVDLFVQGFGQLLNRGW